MPAGDGTDATAAGMDLVASTADRRNGWFEINKTRDYIAQKTAALLTTIWSVARGGTGATNAADARTNLGITAENTPSGATGTSDVQTDLDYLGSQLASKAPLSDTYTRGTIDAGFIARDAAIVQVQHANFDGTPYNRNITWNRRAAWIGDNGQLGYASSRRSMKQNFEDPDWTPEQLLQVPILHYRYRAAVARERRGEGPAATEIGTIADDLHALGLWEFVIYDGHGDAAEPQGVHYELLGLAALWLAQRAYQLATENAARIAALEAGA